jgi:glutamate decarboxylase
MQNYSLNFSKTSSNLLAQYYNFLRFGKIGYKSIMDAVMSNAHYLEKHLLKSGYFEILTDSKYLPVVVVKLKDNYSFSVYDISRELNQYGWIVPAYSLPKDSEEIVVLRMVVKENFSHDFAQKLLKDIEKVLTELVEKTKNSILSSEKELITKPHGIC